MARNRTSFISLSIYPDSVVRSHIDSSAKAGVSKLCWSKLQKSDFLANGTSKFALARPRRINVTFQALSSVLEERLSQYETIQQGIPTPSSNGHMPARRQQVRLAVPSKGRMSEDTLNFFNDTGVTIKRTNPRQYVASIDALEPKMEVWFQRASDIVRKVVEGDVDFGVVGYDSLVEELGPDGATASDSSVVVVHDALGFGGCHLGVAVPVQWTDVNNIADLRQLAQDRAAGVRQPSQRGGDGDPVPLRVVTKYHLLTKAFFDKHGITPYRLLYADGALEANPHMGSADFIVDLVSTGVTLRENQLKELPDGKLLTSQACLIANRHALMTRPDALSLCHEMLERFEAHLRADGQYVMIANISGADEEEVGRKVLQKQDLGGLAGPTVSRVMMRQEDPTSKWYSVSIVVPKGRLYHAIRQIREIGGRGILVKPVTYIFEDEPLRWTQLLENLGLKHAAEAVASS
mmetsp:Transcript_28545/g.46267  ORF Transcript_28545/g.46267 Transcript_28545/m.46267 type:complete len:463 (-) Transcript_28545:192-1580(-)|eukprot:CAMPEP_0184373158 /NCGR_PEP_ID=MMETSP1089-20130417/164327_1 /TAXON_ID=38269 ORGANISM="Gloeochaete wittrockiana, Strain SAG46.84" /NCGR_SAMPLE_ID=MMETSP1089 /ASSEMBLY_ACC=CAM_ASM_000445 /LENGTH=462 /DNA_ID=CAMNT_0026716081 /DNA_START=38 /DNA_END=1426 /DNA_ORIENTATION=+